MKKAGPHDLPLYNIHSSTGMFNLIDKAVLKSLYRVLWLTI